MFSVDELYNGQSIDLTDCILQHWINLSLPSGYVNTPQDTVTYGDLTRWSKVLQLFPGFYYDTDKEAVLVDAYD
ncbi:hypothetical protein EWB00_000781 [Schistosoma japonicum]|uniref:Uncharacterized protein n=1 Tax=Schistosoma japonicum TaxID=6182 RepID=A0A4Z2DIL5_SCHJA|nr:hypothetical protein EWB00_000781 [Schistosoma japonicum]